MRKKKEDIRIKMGGHKWGEKHNMMLLRFLLGQNAFVNVRLADLRAQDDMS